MTNHRKQRASSEPPATNHAIDWPRVLLAACREIESAPSPPTLAMLATSLGVGASSLQRQFRHRLGISPKAYAQALQMIRLVRGDEHANALDSVFAAGFDSVTAGYDNAARNLGVSPGKIRKSIDIDWWSGLSELGWMLMAATAKGICFIAFADSPTTLLGDLRAALPNARLRNDEVRLRAWFERVRDFLLLPREALDLPLDVRGTAFQASVWRALRKIPLGATQTYADVAAGLGKPTATRAVAGACAANKIALLIPCHRVVAAGGRLAGYRWGVERKATLLERERATR